MVVTVVGREVAGAAVVETGIVVFAMDTVLAGAMVVCMAVVVSLLVALMLLDAYIDSRLPTLV